MLQINRKTGQTIVLSDRDTGAEIATITVNEVHRQFQSVQLGIDAPQSVRINRDRIYGEKNGNGNG